MLRLDLTRLDRDRSAQVEAEIPADDQLWEDAGFALDGPVSVRLRAMPAGSGEVVVRGSVSARFRLECRRCLEPVQSELDEEVTLVFASSDLPGVEEDGDLRLCEPGVAELDLKDAVREEVILAIDPFVVCSPECRGLCPRCGANRNTEACACTEEVGDSRWDALRTLQAE